MSENLNNASKQDLTSFMEELKFVEKFEIELCDAIEVIKKIKDMPWIDIQEWREHLVTNYSKSGLDNFTIELIDRYCSNIDD